MAEPFPTALFLAAAGLLMFLSVLVSRASGRLGVPAALPFLVLGMAAGSEGVGGIAFTDYGLAFRIGTAALALILFDGGLNTPPSALRIGLAPAAVLATVGVAATAGLFAGGARLLGFPWPEALLLGAVVSSTDAAAVFSVLRVSGVHLKRRIGAILELESGLNDPVAVMLTVALTEALVRGAPVDASVALDVARELIVGIAAGVAIGAFGGYVLRRLVLPAAGLYPVLTLSVAMLAFGVPTLLHGSGFLAVYVAGVVLARREMPYRPGILRVHDSVAWFAQVGMFLMLGLLVFPTRLPEIAGPGFALALFLGILARPVVVLLCLLPFRFPPREVLFLGWVGLRGAVPIVLATFPVLAGAPAGRRVFTLVFFIVVVNAVLHGGTVRWITRRLGLQSDEPPPPPAALEIASTRLLAGDVLAFYIEPASAVADSPVREIPFPAGAAIMLILRGRELIAAKGDTVLQPGDHVWVFARPEDVSLLRLMFGRPGGE